MLVHAGIGGTMGVTGSVIHAQTQPAAGGGQSAMGSMERVGRGCVDVSPEAYIAAVSQSNLGGGHNGNKLAFAGPGRATVVCIGSLPARRIGRSAVGLPTMVCVGKHVLTGVCCELWRGMAWVADSHGWLYCQNFFACECVVACTGTYARDVWSTYLSGDQD